MTKVYRFPIMKSREQINNYVYAYVKDYISCQQMMTAVAAMLDGYGISKLHLDGYLVRRAPNIITRAGTFPVVILEATRTAPDDKCPICKTTRGRYIEGEAPVVTFFCWGCGGIYEATIDRMEERGETSEKIKRVKIRQSQRTKIGQENGGCFRGP